MQNFNHFSADQISLQQPTTFHFMVEYYYVVVVFLNFFDFNIFIY